MPYFLSASLHQRLKAAWWATRSCSDGAPTLSALVERIFTEHCITVETARNGGLRFPPAPARAQGTRGAATNRDGYRARAYYLPAQLHDRLKATWWATRSSCVGAPTLSALVESLFTEEAVRLERRHNGGRRFPEAPERARGVSSTAAQRQGEWLRQEWQARRDESP